MRYEQIEELLDEFDFFTVKKVMDFLERKYYDSVESTVTIGELRRTARRLLEIVYEAKESPEYFTASGGFAAYRYMYPGDEKKYLELKFVVTEGSNPCI